jgi:O-antigen ligase
VLLIISTKSPSVINDARLGKAHDLTGIGLVGAYVAWSVISAIVNDSNPLPQVALVLAGGAAYALGRLLGGYDPVCVALVVALGILAATVASGSRAFSGDSVAPPFDYANANGALFALGVASAAIVATLAEKTATRWLAGVLTLCLYGLTVVSASRAATVLATGILLAVLTAHRLGRPFALFSPLLVVAGVAITVIVGLTHGAPALLAIRNALTERRAILWQEALEITVREPLLGVGPGMFAKTSPTAIADADARWAHSAYLQVAAETGVIGALLFTALVLWAYGALYHSRQDARLVVIVTAATTAFAVHAAMDYLVHFATLVVIAALLLGVGTSRDHKGQAGTGASPA